MFRSQKPKPEVESRSMFVGKSRTKAGSDSNPTKTMKTPTNGSNGTSANGGSGGRSGGKSSNNGSGRKLSPFPRRKKDTTKTTPSSTSSAKTTTAAKTTTTKTPTSTTSATSKTTGRTTAPSQKNPTDLKTSIEVCARIRPLQILKNREGFFAASAGGRSPSAGGSSFNPTSAQSGAAGDIVAWDVNEDGDTAAQSPDTELIQGRTHSYTLDHVYGPTSTTRDLYDNSIKSLVSAAMEGYHSSILAYGQTSTGKTFTMTGTRQSPGIIPLCIGDCFRYVRDCNESREYLIRVSYLEVYKEHIRDLLASTPEPVRLFDGPNGLIIRGLKEEVATSPEQVFAILKKGESRRQVGSTHMNQHSSRSHVMVRLWIESSNVGSGSKAGNARVSSLSLVDLAGSESVRLNGAERREEGQYINKSLTTLGQVVMSLSEGKTGHIPYRDSKLTRLLQPSLSGNAQMVLLCCIHPSTAHISESHNTFKFATRAKKIKQKAVINVTPDEKTLLQNYRDEIEDLRKQLAEAKEQQKKFQEKAEQQAVAPQADQVVDGEVKELVEAIKTMERLILKSRPNQTSSTSATTSITSDALGTDDSGELDLLADEDAKNDDDDEDEELLIDLPPRTPETPPVVDTELQSELSRIRGLLGCVLRKKGVDTPPEIADLPPMMDIDEESKTERVLDFSSPSPPAASAGVGTNNKSPKKVDDAEVESLRKQLEQQELTTNLRKADSSFLQSQLQEKDQLLEEVSKVLEAVEKRQSQLERENMTLRTELKFLKLRYGA